MKYNQDTSLQIVYSLKKGIDEIIRAVELGMMPGNSLMDQQRHIEAQQQSYISAKELIFKLYKQSESEGMNQTKWIVSRIKKILQASETPVRVLTEALSSRIEDVEDENIDPKRFYANKSKAGDSLFAVLSATKELEKLLDSQQGDTFVMEEESEFAQSPCEIYADIEQKMKYKSGYNEEYDCIVIDPNGSIGEIRDVYGLRIALPKEPPLSSFWNNNIEDPEDQFWQRKQLPSGLSPETKDKHEVFINSEFRRKREGIWFKNNGKSEYITGAHWFLMQHGKTDAEGDDNHEHGYFHFRSAHRDFFYFVEAVWVDPRCLGMIYEKTRRTGATFCLISFMICKAITMISSNFGMTSKTGDDAEAIFNLMIVPMFQSLPFYFQPNRLADNPKGKYEFKQPFQKRGKSQQGKKNKDYSLRSTISYRNTTNDAYDQYALKMYLGDEFSKWKMPANILPHWRMISRAMTKGKKYTGKAYLISTIENVNGLDYDDPKAGSGDRYKKLYYDSDPEVRNRNNHTASGLYKLFIPCTDNFEGYIDKYGYPVKETPDEPIEGVDGEMIYDSITDYLEAEASSEETQAEIYDFWRLNPRTEMEGFKVSANECQYNVQLLDNQITYNEGRLPEELYTVGNFVPVPGCDFNNPATFKVMWKPAEKGEVGRWKVAWHPPRELRNQKIIRNGKVYPFNTTLGCFGCDPFRVNQTVSRKQSNGSIHGLASFGHNGSPYGLFFAEYIFRPEDTDTLTKDLIYACVYYGMEVLVETNVPGTVKSMYDWGYTGYSMRRPDKHPKRYTIDEKRYGGMPSSTGNIDDLANEVGWYINNFVGNDEYVKNMPFNRTLIDWMQFKKENRTKHDAHVSSSLTIFANKLKISRGMDTKLRDTQSRKLDHKLIKTLSNSGIF